MELHFTHKPNYFFFAERFIHFLKQKVDSESSETHLHFPLNEIYDTFHEDFASTTINLDGILSIVKQYEVNHHHLINSYIIDGKHHTLDLEINVRALNDLKHGHDMTPPEGAS